MSFNKIFTTLEVIILFLLSGFCFFLYPLETIAFLFVYSIFRNTYYLLAFFTFSYDLLFYNYWHGVPKLSLFIFMSSAIVFIIVDKLVRNIRTSSRLKYDF